MPQGLSTVERFICSARQTFQLDFLVDLPKPMGCVTLGSLFLPIGVKFVVPALAGISAERRYYEAVLRTIFPSPPARESFGEELGELVVGDRFPSLRH